MSRAALIILAVCVAAGLGLHKRQAAAAGARVTDDQRDRHAALRSDRDGRGSRVGARRRGRRRDPPPGG